MYFFIHCGHVLEPFWYEIDISRCIWFFCMYIFLYSIKVDIQLLCTLLYLYSRRGAKLSKR